MYAKRFLNCNKLNSPDDEAFTGSDKSFATDAAMVEKVLVLNLVNPLSYKVALRLLTSILNKPRTRLWRLESAP